MRFAAWTALMLAVVLALSLAAVAKLFALPEA